MMFFFLFRVVGSWVMTLSKAFPGGPTRLHFWLSLHYLVIIKDDYVFFLGFNFREKILDRSKRYAEMKDFRRARPDHVLVPGWQVVYPRYEPYHLCFIFTLSAVVIENVRAVIKPDPYNSHLDISLSFLSWVVWQRFYNRQIEKRICQKLYGRGSVVPKTVNRTSSVADKKPYQKSPILPTIAFGSKPYGEQSSQGSGGDHINQVDHQVHDSATSSPIVLAPIEVSNSSSTSSVADKKPYQKSPVLPTITLGSKPYGEQSSQGSGGEDHINQVDHQVHDSAISSPIVLAPIEVSNSSSVVADHKPYKNLALFPDKYGPDVGSVRSRPWGGEQSSPGGDGEDHIIEAHHQGHDSEDISGSIEMASPALNNTSSVSDQSVRGSADGQPPPDRSPSDMERGEDPPRTVRRRNSSVVARLLNTSSVAKVFLVTNSGVCLVPSQIRSNAGTTLSANANTLLLWVELFSFAGFLSCCGAYIFQRRRRASRVMTVMGCVAAICGLLSIVGTRFPEKAMLWLTAALCILPISALPLALKEFV